MRTDIETILSPRSIAVIGASPTPGTYGERCLRHFDKLGFSGDVFCVNPRYDKIQRFPCFPSVEALPFGIDTALITVNRDAVVPALEQLGRKGCRGAVVLSAGFGETKQGIALQDELLQTAKRSGVRLFGPNTNGLVNVIGRVPLGVSSVMERPVLRPGPLAVVSQSGSLAASLADAAMDRGVGVSYVLAIGNAIDIGIAEVLDFLKRDDHTRTALMFLEGIGEPKAFFHAVRGFIAAGKKLVLLKAGRSPQGQSLAASHSGAIAGSWDAFRTLALDCGAVVAETPESALALAATAAGHAFRVAMPRLRVVTMSGALSGLVADESARIGLPLQAPADQATRSGLEAMGFREPLNPLDFGQVQAGAKFKPDLFKVCELLLTDPDGDALLVATGLTNNLSPLAQHLTALKKQYGRPIFAYALGGAVAEPFVAALASGEVPVFRDLRLAIEAIRHSGAVESARREEPIAPGARPHHQSLLATAVESPTEHNLARFLQGHGLRYPESIEAGSAEHAADAAQQLGYPVVLKVVGPKILHKAASGLIRLPLRTTDEVRSAFDQCRTDAEAAGMWDGKIIIQKLIDIRGGVELILGARRDREVGPFLLIGPGGVLAETTGGTAIAALPHDADEVQRMIARNGLLRKLFEEEKRGFDRDSFAANVVAFADAARSALDHFSTIEVNPLVIMPERGGCWALDASAVPIESGQS
jgi:acyl-CoA synthetase (NDP forming)